MTVEELLTKIPKTSRDILDVGQTAPKEYRTLFPDANYRTLDINPLSGADIIGDAHNIPVPDASFDAVIAVSLLEHLHSPHLFAAECERILRPGGYVFVSAPFFHPYHGGMNLGGHCPDYYRFSNDGLGYLFRNFDFEIFWDYGVIGSLRHYLRFPVPFDRIDFLYKGKTKHQYTIIGTKKGS